MDLSQIYWKCREKADKNVTKYYPHGKDTKELYLGRDEDQAFTQNVWSYCKYEFLWDKEAETNKNSLFLKPNRNSYGFTLQISKITLHMQRGIGWGRN